MKNPFDSETVIRTVDELAALYGDPPPRALLKELDHLSAHYQAFVTAASFALIASVGPEGCDISPRGDAPGFVRIFDERTLLLPDRRGNNRVDTLTNIVRDEGEGEGGGRVALLFLVPGVGETLRVNGRARAVTDPELCKSFEFQGKLPRSVIVIRVEKAYFQCQKALVRSQLWQPDTWPERSQLPTAGEMLQAIDRDFDADSYDRGYPEHMKKTLY